MADEAEILALLDRHLRSIWEGDLETYAATTAPDVTFFEWYISTQRKHGLDFHLREIAATHQAAELRRQSGALYRVEHEVLAPQVQVYSDVAIVTYSLLMRYTTGQGRCRTPCHESSGSLTPAPW